MSGPALLRRAAVGLTFLLGALLLGTIPAAAHAELRASEPAHGEVLDTAPQHVRLTFNEPVQPVSGATQLLRSGAAPQELPVTSAGTSLNLDLPELAEGTHSLAYRVISADGHPVGGMLTFHIGRPSEAVCLPPTKTAAAATELAVRTLTVGQYAGLLLFGGLTTAWLLHPRARWPRAQRTSGGLAAVAGALLVPAGALRTAGAAPNAVVDPAQWLPHVSGLAALGAVLVTTGVLLTLGSQQPRPIMACLAAAVAVVAPVLVGHSQSVEPLAVMRLADGVHLLLAAFWGGGLLALARVVRHIAPHEAATTVVRFSGGALISVIGLVASGTVMAVLVLDSWADLPGTPYGRNLLIKIGLVLTVAAIAAWNRTHLVPAVISQPDDEGRWLALRAMLRREIALLAVILVITGALTATAPGRHEHDAAHPAGPVQIHGAAQGIQIDGVLNVTTPGQAELELALQHDGSQVTDTDVEVSAYHPAREIGPVTVAAHPTPRGYAATLDVPVPGTWQITIAARVSRFEQPLVPLDVVIPAADPCRAPTR